MTLKHGIIGRGREQMKGRSLKAKLRTGAVCFAVCVSCPAWGQITQSLGYTYTASALDTSLSLDHSLQGMELRVLDFSFNQSTSYSLDTGLLGSYQGGLDINDDENFFGNVSGVYGADTRSIGAFVDNRFARDRFEVGLSASGNLEWGKSTFGDEGLLDPDFDILEFTDEELDAVVWVRSHFLESAYSLNVNQFSIGRLKIRPRSDGTVGHSDFGGFAYSIAGATGFSIAPKEEDDDEFNFFLEESNLSAEVPGGDYGAGDGELVIAAGHDSDGLTKLAALIFKRLEPSDKVEFSIDATGSLKHDSENSVAFDAASFRLGAGFRPNENWTIDNAFLVSVTEDFIPLYSLDSSLDFQRFQSFSPYVRFTASYSEGEGEFSLPVGFSSTVYDKLQFAAELSPAYSTADQSYDVDATGSITLLGPSFAKEGPESEFSIATSASLLTNELSVSLSGRVNF